MNDLIRRIRLEALVTEREGMIVANESRVANRHSVAYDEEAFLELVERMLQLIPTPLDKSDIRNLTLPAAIIKKIHSCGVETIDQLARCSEQDLYNLKGIGYKAVGQITDALKDYALLKLKGELL